MNEVKELYDEGTVFSRLVIRETGLMVYVYQIQGLLNCRKYFLGMQSKVIKTYFAGEAVKE